jgi:S-adenosylmethionine hydrolase
MIAPPPCIALLTDFGLQDPYVGVMKGVIAGIAPGATLIDVTHGVPPQDVRAGALHLDAAWRYFPVGTAFVCVVDPGVGTSRRPVALRADGRWFVGPDNGLFGLLPVEEARAIDMKWSLPHPSRTFHGRSRRGWRRGCRSMSSAPRSTIACSSRSLRRTGPAARCCSSTATGIS